ncbi:reverse transcriptase domain-containing protein [Tanacetum coccineum]
MSVRLAKRSFQHPIGIAKNMFIEVGKFTFPMDFVILEMDKDSKVPLILGRPFLYTTDAAIRVKQKQINLGVGSERMTFSINYAIKQSYLNDDTCFSIDVIDKIFEEDFDALLDEGSEMHHSIEGTILEEKLFAEFDEFMAINIKENSESKSNTEEPPLKKITFITNYKIKTSLEEPPSDLDLKPLHDHLEYVFLEEPTFLPVIISSQLSKAKQKQTYLCLEVYKAKIDVISKLLPTTNVKGIRSFLGHSSFYQRFIKDFLKIARPLTKFLEKDTALEFDDEFGAVLGQKDEFDIEIKDKKGTENVAANHLSRIDNDEASDDNDVDDKFSGETLMELTTKDIPWFADFANYLVGDIIPKGMMYQQKNKFFFDLKSMFRQYDQMLRLRTRNSYHSRSMSPRTYWRTLWTKHNN